MRVGSGAVGRLLRVAALWNAFSVPNALWLIPAYAQIPTGVAANSWLEGLGGQLWLLPVCLLLTKLCAGYKAGVLAGAAGVAGHVWDLLASLDERAAAK